MLSPASGDCYVNISSGAYSGAATADAAMGVKAANAISVEYGAISILSSGDGMHADARNALDNGSSSSGDISISGGRVEISSDDDAFHAGGSFSVTGGSVNVDRSHEGVEANTVYIGGGAVRLVGTDDGINAQKGAKTPLIEIAGGSVDITVPDGDTDGIDSNGNFTMSGGFVIVRCGAAIGNTAGSVDVDGRITVTGGTIIAVGGICETPVSGSVNNFVARGVSLPAGSYSVTGTDGTSIAFVLENDYSSVWIASDLLGLGGAYSIETNGGAVVSWTQNAEKVTN